MSGECLVCGADIPLGTGIVPGELVDCGDCGTELEITQVDPLVFQEAPQAEEDWGE